MHLIVNITSLLLVDKLKLKSPYYLPYLNAFPSIIAPYINPTYCADIDRLYALYILPPIRP